ncbi:MAG: transporter [Cyanobacteria bacterium WB6_1B_304]|jgi:cadmium resistance protein CadD (predicted permease)|nr:transporter [Cyanobacteria bacterium WB6_1B_304]
MDGATTTIVTGISVFTATSLDDILILTVYFAQANIHKNLGSSTIHTLQRRHIIAGQYVGFTALILISLPGFWGGQVIPQTWLGWLGFLPITIGIQRFFQLNQHIPSHNDVKTNLIAAPQISWQPLITILKPQTVQITLIAIANGGDNIAIYIPLFARSSLSELILTLSCFFILIAIWCIVANHLSSHPFLSPPLVRYGQRLAPFVLIGLGLIILLESFS